MASRTSSANSLAVTLAHAIAYLTRPLIVHYSAATILKLQLALDTNLSAQYAATWVPSEPLRGSGRRCLTMSPATAPPRAVHNACAAARVEWSTWIQLLGNVEFDLFIDPGCISVRFGNWDTGKAGKFLTVWSEELAAKGMALPSAKPKPAALQTSKVIAPPSKTFAQTLLENDSEEENELFAMIADEVRDPTWITPILAQFPTVPAYPPVLDFDASSRPSSRASTYSSSALSTFSSQESIESASSYSSDAKSGMSRRERSRHCKVFIDTSKNEVTNYDGGKTTVLTGGVMLGAMKTPKAPSKHSPSPSIASSSSSSSFTSGKFALGPSAHASWRASVRA